MLTTSATRMRFTLNEQIMSILQRFPLDHLAKLETMKIDKDLITTVVKRWSRETHTFHLRVGEMTITLEDMSCLWGLPINGYPITGFADDNWEEDVLHAFGRVDWQAFRRPPGTYHLSASWLCEPWGPIIEDDNDVRQPRASLPANANAEEVGYYACAYMLDLFSSIMFPDHSGFLQSMYLQYIQDIDNPPPYSWASAVLACLYRGLCDASEANAAEICGPLMLL
jgi:Plant mobile domain